MGAIPFEEIEDVLNILEEEKYARNSSPKLDSYVEKPQRTLI
jgi:hypothetical protein